jgi:flavorubredoxin
MYDVSATHVSYILAEAFRFKAMVMAAITYNGGIFVNMDNLLRDITAHNLQNRYIATMDNGTWAALAGKQMREELSKLNNCVFVEPHIALKSALSEAQYADLEKLATELAAKLQA